MSAPENNGGVPRRRRTSVLWTLGVTGSVIALVAGYLAVDSFRSQPAQQQSYVVADDPTLTFPRSGTYFLDQDVVPTVDDLARYDMIVMDAEWGHRLPRSFFEDLRARDPRITLLAYVNLVDKMPRTGSPDYWSNAYSLWQFTDSTHDTFPDEWLAYTADGRPVHEWPNHIMTNLTDVAPRVDGRNYEEYVADWVTDTIWSTGIWDGIFLDVWGDTIYGADSDHWDIDRDGDDEPDSAIYGPDGPLDRGLRDAEQIMRSRMPAAILIANGDRTAAGGNLDGLAFEGFADRAVDPERQLREELTRYVDRSTDQGFRQPGIEMTINARRGVTPGTPDDYGKARFQLTASLMQNAFWAPMGAHYGEIAYYDELDGGGLGRGYLGHPLESNPTMQTIAASSDTGTGSPADGVFRRDFEHGIALTNTTGKPARIELERPYRRLTGEQDPQTNNGEIVSVVTIPPEDGLILLRVDP